MDTQAFSLAQNRWLVLLQRHVPPEQISPGRHALPHVPQLAVSLARVAQRPRLSQNVCPEGHAHAP
jgi:hypothetical protein